MPSLTTVPTTSRLPRETYDFSSTRRWVSRLSMIGAVNMALGSLRQLGIVHHLPDPPIDGLDSDAVITSPQAFALGVPDAPIAMSGLLANVALAHIGGRRRSATAPWIPIGIAAKAVVEVGVASWYLFQMRTRLRVWCAYCLTGATISAIVATLSMREAFAALPERRAKLAGAVVALALAGLAFGAMQLLDARRSA